MLHIADCVACMLHQVFVSCRYGRLIVKPFQLFREQNRIIEIRVTDIEEQAQERFERIVEQMKQAQGITEQLKAENALEWVGRMNNIQTCAREIVDKEIIY